MNHANRFWTVAGFLVALVFSMDLSPLAGRPILPPREERKKEPPPSDGLQVGPQGLFVNGQFTNADAMDKRRQGNRAKVYQVRLVKGKTYTIDMVSQAVDSYLRLESPTGNLLAEDDDGGGFPNARIIYRATEDGVYRVTSTTFVPALGAYSLTIREQ